MSASPAQLAWLHDAVAYCERLQTADPVEAPELTLEFRSIAEANPSSRLFPAIPTVPTDRMDPNLVEEGMCVAVLQTVRTTASYLLSRSNDGTSIVTIAFPKYALETSFTAKCEAFAAMGAYLCIHVQRIDAKTGLKLRKFS